VDVEKRDTQLTRQYAVISRTRWRCDLEWVQPLSCRVERDGSRRIEFKFYINVRQVASHSNSYSAAFARGRRRRRQRDVLRRSSPDGVTVPKRVREPLKVRYLRRRIR